MKPLPSSFATTDSSQYLLSVKPTSTVTRSLRFDEKGRELNEFGEVIEAEIIKPEYTLAINRKQQPKSQINPYLASLNSTKAGFKNKLKNRSLLDPRIKVSSRDVRRKNALTFIKQGTYTKLAEEMRSKTARALVSKQTLAEALKPEIPADSQAPETPIPDATSLPPPPHNPVPAMEWWDADFLPAELRESVRDGSFTGSFGGSDAWSSLRFDLCLTKDVVEHPVPVERNRLPAETAPVVMYTKKVDSVRAFQG